MNKHLLFVAIVVFSSQASVSAGEASEKYIDLEEKYFSENSQGTIRKRRASQIKVINNREDNQMPRDHITRNPKRIRNK